MSFITSVVLSVIIGFNIKICYGLTSQQDCPSQVQSTMKMAESIDQLSKVLNQSINENLKSASEKLTDLPSSFSSQLIRQPKTLKDLSSGGNENKMDIKVEMLEREVNKLKLALFDLKHDQQLSKTSTSSSNDNEDIFFSLASSKSIHCYNCIITYDVAHVNSHPRAIDPAIGIFVAPVKANYFFQFHALVKEHKQAKVQFLINNVPKLYMFDRDNGSQNQRFAMISQSFIYQMEKGDTMAVRLHEGALKGGGIHAFTSFTGMKIGTGGISPMNRNIVNEIQN